MSDYDQFFDGESNRKSYRFNQQHGPIDFFRAYCNQTSESNSTPDPTNKEHRDDILALVKQMKRLIREYAAMSERVGTDLKARVLDKVVEALQRESLGMPNPLEAVKGRNATEKFLTESLYDELLEFRILARQNSNDWKLCLDLLSDFLPDSSRSYAN